MGSDRTVGFFVYRALRASAHLPKVNAKSHDIVDATELSRVMTSCNDSFDRISSEVDERIRIEDLFSVEVRVS